MPILYCELFTLLCWQYIGSASWWSLDAQLDSCFITKPGSIWDPKHILGAKFQAINLANGMHAWEMSSSTHYIHDGKTFASCQWAKRTSGPFPLNHNPEIDMTLELKADQAVFIKLKWCLGWCMELWVCWFDIILMEVLELVAYLALPKERHLEPVFHLLVQYPGKATQCKDCTIQPNISGNQYEGIQRLQLAGILWKCLRGTSTKCTNAPWKRCGPVAVSCFGSRWWQGNTPLATTGLLPASLSLLNSAPINCLFSKKQLTVTTRD